MRWTGFARGIAATFAALVFLSSCVVVEEPGPVRPGPGPGPGFCTREFQPVCAGRGNERRTFSNACLADRSGFRPIHRGECRGGSSQPPRACTLEFQPVCAQRGSTRRTFSNACTADASGFRVLHRGECRQGGGGGGGQQQVCTREYRPVCARQGGQLRTFGNSCEADAAGWRVIGPGRC
ncbi:MAG: hypothetical protein JNK47_05790 [Mesorhizobium sp.]|nr:Kazal-type serine protease inhibitor domain-containing protein [Mesorhizobium sp.]MBL8576715.1 hypothetical protein [Mesorhizobium sp.]